jgi:hypothetical protein
MVLVNFNVYFVGAKEQLTWFLFRGGGGAVVIPPYFSPRLSWADFTMVQGECSDLVVLTFQSGWPK